MLVIKRFFPFFGRERRSFTDASPPSPREEFLAIWAHLGRQRQQAWVLAGLCLLSNLFLAVSYVSLANRSRLVPYVFAVDRTGDVVPLGKAQAVATDDPRLTVPALEAFLVNVRAVYRDPLAQKEAASRAYLYLSASARASRALRFVEAYYRANDPRTMAKAFSRSIEVVSIIPVSSPSSTSRDTALWQLRWRETSYPTSGGSPTFSDWQAFATVRVAPATYIEQLDRNPFRVLIEDLSWSRVTPETPVVPKGALR